MIKYKLKTAPAAEAVTLAEAKAHLKVYHDEQNVLIQGYLDSAVEDIENITGRRLITQTWNIICNTWAEVTEIIKFGKLQSVASIKYLDEDRAEQTVLASLYIVSGIGTDEGQIVFFSDGDFSYPAVFEVEPITVEFVCGYGLPISVPEVLKNAIKFQVSDVYAGICTDYCIDAYRLWKF